MGAQGNHLRRFTARIPGYTPFVDEHEHSGESLIDRLRGTGVGVEDPNIVGDVGPTDIPPGRDPQGDGLFADPPDPLDEGVPIEPVDSVEPPDLLVDPL
jgi:hypothetical protein